VVMFLARGMPPWLSILYTILLDIGARRDRDSVAQRGRGK
jgi:hypothetical protein